MFPYNTLGDVRGTTIRHRAGAAGEIYNAFCFVVGRGARHACEQPTYKQSQWRKAVWHQVTCVLIQTQGLFADSHNHVVFFLPAPCFHSRPILLTSIHVMLRVLMPTVRQSPDAQRRKVQSAFETSRDGDLLREGREGVQILNPKPKTLNSSFHFIFHYPHMGPTSFHNPNPEGTT